MGQVHTVLTHWLTHWSLQYWYPSRFLESGVFLIILPTSCSVRCVETWKISRNTATEFDVEVDVVSVFQGQSRLIIEWTCLHCGELSNASSPAFALATVFQLFPLTQRSMLTESKNVCCNVDTLGVHADRINFFQDDFRSCILLYLLKYGPWFQFYGGYVGRQTPDAVWSL